MDCKCINTYDGHDTVLPLWSVIKPPCLLSWIRFVSENLELVALHLDVTSTVLNTTSPKVQEWTFHEVESLMFFEKAMVDRLYVGFCPAGEVRQG